MRRVFAWHWRLGSISQKATNCVRSGHVQIATLYIRKSLVAMSTDNGITNSRGISRRVPAADLLAGMAVFWLLGSYMLPNTVFGRISPTNLMIPQMAHGADIRLSAASIVVLVAALALLSVRVTRRRSHAGATVLIVAAALGLRLVVSVFGEGRPGGAFDNTSTLAALAVGLLAGCYSSGAVVLVCLSSVQAFYAMYDMHYQSYAFHSGELQRAVGSFDNPESLSIVMLASLPISICAASRAKSSASQFLLLAGCGGQFAALTLCWSRGGAVAIGCAVIWLVWYLTRSRWSVAMSVLFAVLFALLTFHQRATDTRVLSTLAWCTSEHLDLWRSGFGIFGGQPLIGAGIGALSLPISIPTGIQGLMLPQTMRDPQNVLIYCLASMGILGGLLYGAYVWAVIGALKFCRDRWTASGLGAAWVALAVAGMFNTIFLDPVHLVGSVLLGLLTGSTVESSGALQTPSERGEGHGL